MSNPTEILLATRSAGKLREIRAMTADLGWNWRGLEEFPDIPEAIEDGATFRENATKKAVFYAGATGMLALADDSGLEVDALNGAPGVHSAYYAGQPRNDAANNRRLARALADLPLEKRTARFCCYMVLGLPSGAVLAESDGKVEGLIAVAPAGEGGFGYDPYFLLPDRGVTMAQLSGDEKNKLSHRGRALRAMITKLQQLWSDNPRRGDPA